MPKKAFRFSPRQNKAAQIKWNIWGMDAFEKAKKENKPVLLSISAVWCHWCHVMDETSYSDDRVINYINENFVPIRVDNDQNPDINERYNLGGWPTTAVLSPDGLLLNGGTYFPPDELLSFLNEMVEYYQKHKLALEKANYKSDNEDDDLKVYKPLSKSLLNDVRDYIYRNIEYSYDKLYGGFGLSPKFPHVDILSFLINDYIRTGQEKLYKMLEKTLLNMADGGIYDKEGDGFFRYSTTRDWSIPHYEKMLEDNALIADVYLKAYEVLGIIKFKNVAEKLIKFITDTFLDKEGYFYGSQDADEEYYKLSKELRKKKKQPYIDKNLYVAWNGMVISSLLRASFVLNDNSYKDIALNALDFIQKNCFKSDLGYCRYYDGNPHNYNILRDQIYMAKANINAFEVTGNRDYLKKSEIIADVIYERFYDSHDKVFKEDVPQDAILKRVESQKSIETNSTVALLYMLLNLLKNSEKYARTTKEVLRYFSSKFYDFGIYAIPYYEALEVFNKGFTHVAIVKGRNTGEEMVEEALKRYIPHMFVEQIDSTKDSEIIKQRGYDISEIPVAYICIGSSCHKPIYKTGELIKFLSAIHI